MKPFVELPGTHFEDLGKERYRLLVSDPDRGIVKRKYKGSFL